MKITSQMTRLLRPYLATSKLISINCRWVIRPSRQQRITVGKNLDSQELRKRSQSLPFAVLPSTRAYSDLYLEGKRKLTRCKILARIRPQKKPVDHLFLFRSTRLELVEKCKTIRVPQVFHQRLSCAEAMAEREKRPCQHEPLTSQEKTRSFKWSRNTSDSDWK